MFGWTVLKGDIEMRNIMSNFRGCRIAVAGSLILLAGCATVPDTITTSTPINPRTIPIVPPLNGAIFQASTAHPLFEDRTARRVGDTMTIVINEKTAAGKQEAGSTSRAASVDYSVPLMLGMPPAKTANFDISTSSANKFDGKGATSSSNNFNGTIGVTVIDVLPNGNLMVKGEKQIALDRGAEFIRISGVIDPLNVMAGNIVSSSLVADVRIEYRTNARFDQSDVSSQFAKFFMSVMPL